MKVECLYPRSSGVRIHRTEETAMRCPSCRRIAGMANTLRVAAFLQWAIEHPDELRQLVDRTEAAIREAHQAATS